MKLCSPKLKKDDNQFEGINFINEFDFKIIDSNKTYALSELKSDIVVFSHRYTHLVCKCDMPGRKYTLVVYNYSKEDMYVSFVIDDGETHPFIFSENGKIIGEILAETVVIYELYQLSDNTIAVHQSVLELNKL